MLLHFNGIELTLARKEACYTSSLVAVTTEVRFVLICDVDHFSDIASGCVDYAVAELLRFVDCGWNVLFTLVI